MKQTRAAAVRRRRLATSASVAVLLVVAIVLATTLPTHSHASGKPTLKTTPPSTPSPQTSTLVAAASGTASMHQAIASYVKSRDGAVGVAVYDKVSKQWMVFHPKVRGWTASIVKADILETLLHRTDGHLTSSQRATATSMIEISDNDSATDLWDQDGGATGVTAYNDDLGLKQTVPNDEWGLTRTSAHDQVRIVRELFGHSSLLTPSSQKFQRYLMRHVTPSQRWGIGAGVPKSATFGNKNGWLPVDEDHDLWAVNSIGWVRGDDRKYVIAVVTQHNESENYGITTIGHISHLVWKNAAVGQ